MRYKIEIRETQDEDLIIYASRRSPLLERIEELLLEAERCIFGYNDTETVRLDASKVFCFFIEDSKTYALTDHGKLQIKERLYKVEDIYPENFVKINQSCLVNISKITRFDSSIGGSLLVVLENGYKDYVSRRQLKTVKERMGF